MHNVKAFRADKGQEKSTSLHLKVNTNMSSIAAEISGICPKDLKSSEARYHSSNNAIVRIVVMQPTTLVDTLMSNLRVLEFIVKEVRNCRCTGRQGRGREWAWK